MQTNKLCTTSISYLYFSIQYELYILDFSLWNWLGSMWTVVVHGVDRGRS